MLITDPIGDMLIRIKNALLSGKQEVIMPHSKMKQAIAVKLKENGYISEFKVNNKLPQSEIIIALKYVEEMPAISGIQQISKPGRRLYAGKGEIPTSLNGYGITIVSTNKGVLTNKEAVKLNVGGELICKIW